MTAKRPAPGNTKIVTAVDNPETLKPKWKCVGGSQSDEWNNVLTNQTVHALWLANSSDETQEQQASATVAALIGIGPRDELEGMIAAQLIAAHNAAMECYRRAMIREQTFEGRRENLNQANKLSRTYAIAARGAQPSSRQGSAEGHGRARPCARWRAGCGRHGRDPGGRGSAEIRGSTPCKANYPCTSAHDVAHGRGAGSRVGRQRCRTVGVECTAELSPGAPKGNKNAFKHGRYTAEAAARRRDIASLLRSTRRLAKDAE